MEKLKNLILLELRLWFRNKHTRHNLMISFIMILFYGFLLFLFLYLDRQGLLLKFRGTDFTTTIRSNALNVIWSYYLPTLFIPLLFGIFSLSYLGQNIKFLFSQKFSFKLFLFAEYYLLIISTLITSLLSLPIWLILPFDLKTVFLLCAFNIPIIPLITILMSYLNLSKTDLQRISPTRRTNTIKQSYMLFGISILPAIVYTLLPDNFKFLLVVMGIIIFALHPWILSSFATKIRANKYAIIKKLSE